MMVQELCLNAIMPVFMQLMLPLNGLISMVNLLDLNPMAAAEIPAFAYVTDESNLTNFLQHVWQSLTV